MIMDLEHLNAPVPEWLREAMTVPRNQKSITVEDCEINYFTWGDPQRQPLVFLHGRMSHARCWAFIAPSFAERYFCIAIDQSGMGDSGHRDTYTYQTRAREVLAIIDAEVTSLAPLIVTHSYGCVLALNVIAEARFAFAGLVACDPSLTQPSEWDTQTPRTNGPELERPGRFYDSVQEIQSRWRFAPPQSWQHEVLKDYIAVHSAKEVNGRWTWKFDPWVYSSKEEGHNDWWVTHTQDFLSAQLPKAVIYGEQSEMLNQEIVAAVVAQSGSHIHVQGIPNAHHHIMVDEPHLLTSAIDQAATALLT